MKQIARLFTGVLVAMFLCGPAAAQVTVHEQRFESWGSWNVYYPSETTANWSLVSSGSHPTCSPQEPSKMAEFDSYYADSYDVARAYSPEMDLTGYEVVECRFWMYRDDGASGNDDLIKFQYTLDDGDHYYTLKEFKRYSSTVGWEEKVVHLGNFNSVNNLKIGLRGKSRNGNNIYIDHLRVTKYNLPDRAEGKACSTAADCDSGICGQDPGGNGRCRAATTDCIGGHRQPMAVGEWNCYQGDVATCTGTNTWSITDCLDDCGPYLDVHTCDMYESDKCAPCERFCDPFFGFGCDANSYCGFFSCYYKKNDGESCGANKECLSNNCVSAPNTSKFCEPAGTPCAANDGSPVSVGATTCNNNDLLTCLSGGGWSTTDCYTNCGFYLDVDECVGSACTECPTSCQNDTECKTGIPCTGNQCIGDLPNGQTCQSPNQCASNYCVDGVCCADVCSAPCHRCDVTNNEGTCTMLADGQDPDDECPGDGLCDGTCNGLGGCNYPGQTTICDVCTLCDGSGHCWLYQQAGGDPNDECSPCQACNGGAPGCANVPNGQDALGDCDAQAETTCGLDGECDGAGACRQWVAGTECGMGSCSNGNAVFPDSCDGSGQCVDGGSGNCGFYRCADASRCADSCTTHATCVPAGYCAAAGTCEPDLGEGADCQDVVFAGQIDDQACMGGYCFDDNFDSDGAFCTSDPAACVHDGMVFSNNYVLCASDNSFYRACIGGALGWDDPVSCAAGLCDAGGGDGSGYRSGGSCNSGPGGGCTSTCTACEPYMAADAGTCRATCTLETHCWPGYECRGGACQIPQGIGDTCQTQADCTVGTCVDGVCCNDSCAGPCRSCNQAGFCTMADEGLDPDNDCDTLPADICKTTGVCDGSGNCSLWPSGTACGAAHCQGAVLAGASSCNGAGDCIPGQDTDCRPGRCAGDACVSTCTSHAECDPTGFCGAAGNCLVDLADLESCDDVVLSGLEDDPACLGGFCFEDSWSEQGAFCTSEGDACVAEGSIYDPGFRLCSNDDWYRVCIGGEDGWGGEVQCADGDICDAGAGPGSGVKPAETCNSGFTGGCSSACVSCFPYLAEALGVCAISCVEDAECWPGYLCNAGICERGAGLGDACTTDADCTGWICVDSVCCSSACEGDCRVCNNPSYLGVCVYVQEGTDPADDCDEQQQDPCGLTGVCDGEGACAFQPEGTECAPQSCVGGVLTAASYCDGDGACVEGKPSDCPSGVCEDDRCAPEGVDGADGEDGGADGDGGIPDGSDAGNQPPVAEAGPTQAVSPGTPVTLDGSASRDPEGEDLTFLWEQTSGPEEVSLSGATTPRPGFTPRLQGVYVFRLVVNDGTYDSAPDFTEVQAEAGAESCGCGKSAGGGLSALALLTLLGMLVRWGRRS